MGIMGLFPEIPIIPAFPEIPENSPKKAKPFNNTHLRKLHNPISWEKGSDTTPLSPTTLFLVRRGQTQRPLAPQPYFLSEGSDTTPLSTTTLFLGRRGQICSIAKEDPLGIVHLVQPEGSYFWDGTKMCPLSQEISYTLNSRKPYKSNNHSDMPCSPDRTVDSDPYHEYHP